VSGVGAQAPVEDDPARYALAAEDDQPREVLQVSGFLPPKPTSLSRPLAASRAVREPLESR
jgi:hypothetical protein